MTPSARGPHPGEQGFVLIGVVIFVIALSIIVLSLYSLSSYEAQFLQRSLDDEQAFQSAVGGIERAKFALSVPPYLLESVAQNLPEGVISARAVQVQAPNPDSLVSGPVFWNPAANPVLIQVTSLVNGRRRTVEACFEPRMTQDYYSQVITTSGSIVVDSLAALEGGQPTDRRWTIDLLGPVSEGAIPSDVSAWRPFLRIPPDSIRTNPVSPPHLAEYFAQYPVSAVTPASFDLRRVYELNAPLESPKFFCAPDDRDHFYYNKWTATPDTVWVHGLAIWEFPRGVRFDAPLCVKGLSGTDCLVIVAGRAGPQPTPENDPQTGIRLFAGLRADLGVSVILVSDGRVYLQNISPLALHSYAYDIAVYAQDVTLTGPETRPFPPPARFMTLEHSADGSLDNVYVNLLANQGALPDVGAVNGRSLTLVSGTWHATDR